jgi:hypothetical protein
MPIDPFLALNALIRAEAARSAEPGAEPAVRRESPGTAVPAGERKAPAPARDRTLGRDHGRDLG